MCVVFSPPHPPEFSLTHIINAIVKPWVRGIITDIGSNPQSEAQGRGRLSSDNPESCHG